LLFRHPPVHGPADLADPAVARLLARMGLVGHRPDADRTVRDHRTSPAGNRSRGTSGHRRLPSLRRARGGPGYLGGDRLRPLPVEPGPSFPLDEDAHLLVLALPRGDVVDTAPPGGGPIPADGNARRPIRVPRSE